MHLFAMQVTGMDFSSPQWSRYISRERWALAEKRRQGEARQLFLGAEVLLNRGLERLGTVPIPAAYAKNQYGKPYLSGYSDIYVNWSHSGEYVFLGISDREIGLDLQCNRKEPKESLVKKVLRPKELEYYQGIPEERKKDCFYEFWTLKESFLKALGTGVATSLEDFYIERDESRQPQIVQKINKKTYRCILPDFWDSDYTAAVCREGRMEATEIEDLS